MYSKNVKYDSSDPNSIECHAKLLINESLSSLYETEASVSYTGKGRLGQLVEKIHFGYEPNSDAEPDFKEAGVELKTTPLRRNSKGLVSKERLVFNMIDYNSEHQRTFAQSSFWKKNSLLLLIFYIHEKGVPPTELKFKFARLWRFPKEDLRIIINDWKKIIKKIKEGKAHEISEGDTFYLGACTKGSTKLSSRTDQPFSKEKAQKRAFSLKSKYINHIIERSLRGDNKLTEMDQEYLSIVQEESGVIRYRSGTLFEDLDELEPIVKDLKELDKHEDIEELIKSRFERYYGHSEGELKERFSLDFNQRAKNKNYLLAKAILGISKQKIAEFEKADIEMKTIKLESSGALKESMSFAQIKYMEILDETWEDSYLYNKLTKRFFFVVFKRDANKVPRLYKVFFWTMPNKDLQVAEEFWRDTRKKVKKGQYDTFWKISDDRIFHVRPKGINARDLMETPQGGLEKKKSYWLNSNYIKSLISNSNDK